VTDARAIVEAMHGDLDRFQARLRRRSLKILRSSMIELRAELFNARIGEWGAASNLAALSLAGSAVERLQTRQAAALGRALPAVAKASQGRQADLLHALDAKYSGAVRPLRFDTLAWLEDRSASQIRLRQFPRSFARYGAAATSEIEEALAKLALTGEPWTKARAKVWGAVKGVVGDRQWMVDRILRTETAAIYNGTALAAMEAEDTPDDPMFKRLVSIFDNVTGQDSYGQHGQIRRVRNPFQDSKGRLYQAPPNRPHDRAVVIPHRASWGERVEHLERPPVDVVAETSEPAALPKPPPPVLMKRRQDPSVATAAAAVLLLAGQVAERKRVRGPDEPKRPPIDRALLLDLELARVRLAGARLAADASAGEGVRADRLIAGSELAAGGLAVRVVSVKPTPAGLRVVLGIGDARLIFEADPGARLPLRRIEPALRPGRASQELALALLAAVLRSSATAPAPAGTTVAMR
jgi:hypothetical protein